MDLSTLNAACSRFNNSGPFAARMYPCANTSGARAAAVAPAALDILRSVRVRGTEAVTDNVRL